MACGFASVGQAGGGEFGDFPRPGRILGHDSGGYERDGEELGLGSHVCRCFVV